MVNYIDASERPIPSPDGHTHYTSIESVHGGTVRVLHYDSVPLCATYEGLARDAVHRYHTQHHAGLRHDVYDAPWTYHFTPDGHPSYKERTRNIGTRAMIVEEWSPDGESFRGTVYLMGNDEIQFAAEFGPEGSYFNAFDFSTSDTMPIEDLLPELAEMGLNPYIPPDTC